MANKEIRINNPDLVSLLKEVLAAMEVKEVNRFRIRAYQNVITAIEGLSQSVQDLWKTNKLDYIPGVGATLKQHFEELFTTGEVNDFNEIRGDLPQGMFSLIGIRGIGAKKAFKLANAFELNDRETAMDDLREAAEAEKIRELDGFAEKSEKDILEAITEHKMHKKEKERLLLSVAAEVAGRLKDFMLKNEAVVEVEALGSLRRRASTIGDLDVAVATKNPEEAIEHFLKFPEIADVMSKGEKGARIVLTTDVQVDMRVIEPKALGAMVQYFTGSKLHNVILRTYALEKQMSLSEYGIKENGGLKEFSTDKAFYEYLGLQYIPPELRQGKNEVDLAKNNELPVLVNLQDIKGEIHTHTVASDGVNEVSEMVEKAKSLGYSYLGISDHAPSVNSRGEKEVQNIISTQKSAIEQISETNKDFRLLFGYEVNILNNATLAMPNEFLSQLDYVIAGVHTSHDQDSSQMTERLLAAVENKYVTMIAHPTNRLLNQRAPSDIDWQTVLKAVKKQNKILEINSQPDRLDLTDDLVYEARKMGIKFIINTDAHAVPHMDLMKYGIDVARRGWCTKENILNTLPTEEFLRILKKDL